MFSATVFPRVALRLTRPDGSPWSVDFSPGIERFIGPYPRVDGMACDGTRLAFEKVETIRSSGQRTSRVVTPSLTRGPPYFGRCEREVDAGSSPA